MGRLGDRKVALKILVPILIAAMLIAAVLLNTPMGSTPNPLSLAIEGGQYTLTSIDRNDESMTYFVQEMTEEAQEVRKAAASALENGQGSLAAARDTDDEYTLRLVENYEILAQASGVMGQGVDNLLLISDDLQSALDYYAHGQYREASEKAAACLETLTPLVSDLEEWNQTLNDLDPLYIASGHRERTELAVEKYREAMETYMQYIQLLRSLLEGADYLRMSQMLDEYLRQLQSATARGDYSAAQSLLQQIFGILQSLRGQNYQNAAATASQLDPNALNGQAAQIAQDLRNRLMSPQAIEDFEAYLDSLQNYLEASDYLQQAQQAADQGQSDLAQGYLDMAEQAVNEGLARLSQGSGQGTGTGPGQGNSQIQDLYAGLTEAFNSLLMRIRGQPDQG